MDPASIHGVLESRSGAAQQSKADSQPPIHSEINETWAEEPSHNLKSHTLQRALYGPGDPARRIRGGGGALQNAMAYLTWLL
ncbi:uncharacterized [Tachysurus ichikawai]